MTLSSLLTWTSALACTPAIAVAVSGWLKWAVACEFFTEIDCRVIAHELVAAEQRADCEFFVLLGF